MPADPVVTLLPCPNPWCDSDHQWAHRIRPEPHFPEWAVACGCGFMGPVLDTEQRAITAWNTRTPTPASGDAGSVREALRAIEQHINDFAGCDDSPSGDEVESDARKGLAFIRQHLAAAPTPDAAASEAGEVERLREATADYSEQALADRQIDFLEARADEWMNDSGVQRMFNAIASVFEKHAPQEVMDRFREKLGVIGRQCHVEGALRVWEEIAAQQRALGRPLPEDPAALTTQGGAEG